MLQQWAGALRTKDIAGVLAHHAPRVEHFALAPPLEATAEPRQALQQWFASFAGEIGYEIRDQQITAGEDVAFCHSLNRVSGKTADGQELDMWFRQTLGLRKSDGEWMITHEHESVPFYMDGSARAAVDLQP